MAHEHVRTRFAGAVLVAAGIALVALTLLAAGGGLAPHHIPGDEEDVRGTLGESPHQVAVPVGAVGRRDETSYPCCARSTWSLLRTP